MGPRSQFPRAGSLCGAALPALFALLVPLLAAAPAAGNSTQVLVSHGLITQDIGDGGDLFFRETFDGNGRTCGSCHPVDNNQTIDPPFIATLPPDDPLFVAENDPNLTELEKPRLMRNFGLILENVDGFEDPTVKFVLRGTPHSLSLATSIKRPPGSNLPTDPLGWGGDGSPLGTLLSFPSGAVKQHFTKTLARNPPADFREPTSEELRVMEEFMLSVGRTGDLDLTMVALADSGAELGRRIFLNADPNAEIAAGKCNLCHLNAGSDSGFFGGNANFDTGVEEVPHLGRTSVAEFPLDGGFGLTDNGDGTFGDGTFNTPPLVEAADTGPFFHNHVIESVEGAVEFYTTRFFAESPAGDPMTGVGPIVLNATEIDAVAAFLRVLNTAFNLAITEQRNGAAISLENSSLGGCGDGGFEIDGQCGGFEVPGKRATVDMLLSLANVEALDGIEVLNGQLLHGSAVDLIKQGINLNEQAIAANGSEKRQQLMRDALAKFQQAEAQLGTIGFEGKLGKGNLMF